MMRLGLVIVILGAVVSFTWWASKVQSSLNTLLSGQQSIISTHDSMQTRVITLERASEMFTQYGSPALQRRIETLEKSERELRLQFELMKENGKQR